MLQLVNKVIREVLSHRILLSTAANTRKFASETSSVGKMLIETLKN